MAVFAPTVADLVLTAEAVLAEATYKDNPFGAAGELVHALAIYRKWSTQANDCEHRRSLISALERYGRVLDIDISVFQWDRRLCTHHIDEENVVRLCWRLQSWARHKGKPPMLPPGWTDK